MEYINLGLVPENNVLPHMFLDHCNEGHLRILLYIQGTRQGRTMDILHVWEELSRNFIFMVNVSGIVIVQERTPGDILFPI